MEVHRAEAPSAPSELEWEEKVAEGSLRVVVAVYAIDHYIQTAVGV